MGPRKSPSGKAPAKPRLRRTPLYVDGKAAAGNAANGEFFEVPSKHYWPYYLDSEGHFWNSDGIELEDVETLLFFMKGMEPLPDGRYQVFCQGEECRITVEDVPYIIRDFEFFPDHIVLKFSGNYSEPLDPSTLHVGKKNVLYCKVRGRKFKARFNRSSYMELAKKIKFDPKKKQFFLVVDKKRYPIVGAAS